MGDVISELSPTPYDIPVVWAVATSDSSSWRTSGIDRFLRWGSAGAVTGWGRWQSGSGFAFVTARWEPTLEHVLECRGRLLAVHPDGYGLVMEPTRMLVLLPLTALRVDAP